VQDEEQISLQRDGDALAETAQALAVARRRSGGSKERSRNG
jgi:hypothetical protein